MGNFFEKIIFSIFKNFLYIKIIFLGGGPLEKFENLFFEWRQGSGSIVLLILDRMYDLVVFYVPTKYTLRFENYNNCLNILLNLNSRELYKPQILRQRILLRNQHLKKRVLILHLRTMDSIIYSTKYFIVTNFLTLI